jgi:Calx-beta domain-containing protein
VWFFLEETAPDLLSADRFFDYSGTVPPPFFLTRSTAALGRDSTGRWVSFPVNTPRSWYDPITLNAAYTLVEPERTQLLYRTRQPTLTTVQASSTVDSVVQTPFGSSGVVFLPNASAATHGWNLFFGNPTHAASFADNMTVSLSVVLKPTGNYTDITFSLLNKTNIYSSVRVSLAGSGVIVSMLGVISAQIFPDTDGFYLVQIVNNYGAGTATPSFNAGFHNAAGTQIFSGDGVSGFCLAYIGAEVGTEPTSPILNPGFSTTARGADVLVANSEWISPGPKTFGMTYIPLSRVPATILNIAGTDQITLSNTQATVSLLSTVNGIQSGSISGPSPASGIERTVVMAFSPGTVLLAQDGVMLGTDNRNAQIPNAFSGVRIGDAVTSGRGGPMLMRRMKYWSQALSQDAALSFSEDLTQGGLSQDRPILSVQPDLTVTALSNAVTLLVLVDGPLTGTTISYSTADGTALSGADYIGTSGNLVIPPGAPSGIITVGLLPRGEIQNKTFRIFLNRATNATISNGVCAVLLLRKLSENTPLSTKIHFGAVLPADVSLSRSSPAWTRNPTGVWTQVASNAYRQHFVTAELSGLLIETAPSEQVLFDSVDPGFSVTGGTSATVTSEITPTGSRQIQFRETTANSQHKFSLSLNTGNSVTPTGTFTVSILVRAVGRSVLVLSVLGIDNILQTVFITLSGEGAVSTGSFVSSIERDPFRPAWYRVTMARSQTVSGNVPMRLDVMSALSDSQTTFTGTTGNGFDLCHIQMEPGLGASSPIIVTGASSKTVRAADILKASGTWYQRQSYSLGVRFRRLRDEPENQQLWMAKDIESQINGVVLKNGLITYDVVGEAPPLTLEAIGTGNQTVWTLPNSGTDGAPYSLFVALDGLIQASGSYTLAGNSLGFSEPPPLGSLVSIRGLPSAKVLLNATGNGATTSWSLPTGQIFQAASLVVSVDGFMQSSGTYNVSGNQVILGQAPPVGAVVSVHGIGNTAQFQEFLWNTSAVSTLLAMSPRHAADGLIVAIDGLVQMVSSYAVFGQTLSFSQTPPLNALIDVRFLITSDAVGELPILNLEAIGTGTQMVWPLPDRYPSFLFVTLNGLIQASDSYSVTSNSIVFSEAPPPRSLISVRGIPSAKALLEAVGDDIMDLWSLPTTTPISQASCLAVAVDGLMQSPQTYSVSENQIVLGQAPPIGSRISILDIGDTTQFQGFVWNTSATSTLLAKSPRNAVNSLIVAIDGVVQRTSSYTIFSQTLSFSETPPINAQIDIRFL